MKFKYSVILAMLLLAVLAVGSVSATEDIAIDDTSDIDIDDVSDVDLEIDDQTSDGPDENLRTTYTEMTITTSSNFTDINNKISDGTYSGYQFNFEDGNYTNFSMVTGTNNKFVGNGAKLIGSTDNLFTITGSSGIVITGFNMNINNANKAAIYGSGVSGVEITNNVISGGKDGINVFQNYEDVIISGNNITGVTRDAISLVNHNTLDDDDWDDWVGATISNNIITGPTQYGMFFGGNFKGTIANNVITNTDCGIEFAGKKAPTNGQLSVKMTGNNITGVTTGINMCHPCVRLFNMTGNTVNTTNSSSNYAIFNNSYFAKALDGRIIVNNNVLNGNVTDAFKNATNTASGNSGTGAYTKP